MISLNGARSGPAISTMPFFGAASATSETMAAASSAAMGWNRTGGSLTMFPSALESAMPRRNSMNWVARMIVQGTPEASISFLLGEFGAEIAIIGPVDCDDGQRNVVPDTSCGLRRLLY